MSQVCHASLFRQVIAGGVDKAFIVLLTFFVAKILYIWPSSSSFNALAENQNSIFSFLQSLLQVIRDIAPVCIAYIVIYLLYFTILLGACGQTLGFLVVRCRVVRTDGSQAGYCNVAKRTFAASFLGKLPVVGDYVRAGDYLAILANKRNRMVRDITAGTMVIYCRENSFRKAERNNREEASGLEEE